jgi:hypothetical protein
MSAKQDFLKSSVLIARMPGRVPVLSPFHGSDYYYLREPIFWLPEGSDVARFQRVDVPIGFVTDLASVPSIFWSLLPKDGAYLHAAIVHDYAYWMQTNPRDAADEMLRIGMRELQVPAWKIAAIYRAVRTPMIGGASAWAKNAERKSAGEKRILKRYPSDPRTTWTEWKTQPDVFVS